MRPRGDFGGGFGPLNQGGFAEQVHRHGGHPFAWLFVIVLLGLLVALVVWAVLRLTSARSARPALVAAPLDDAVDIVRLRYAKGEIDRSEFLRVTADLGAAPEPPPAAAA
jgi:uncharacterized membrane protein